MVASTSTTSAFGLWQSPGDGVVAITSLDFSSKMVYLASNGAEVQIVTDGALTGSHHVF
jgi:hypothetical protein